jgi:hypothetical protein
MQLYFQVDERPQRCQLIIDYDDIAAQKYSTRIEPRSIPNYEVNALVEVLVMHRVELSAGRQLIPWSKPPSLLWRLRRAVRDWVSSKRASRATPPPPPGRDSADPPKP